MRAACSDCSCCSADAGANRVASIVSSSTRRVRCSLVASDASMIARCAESCSAIVRFASRSSPSWRATRSTVVRSAPASSSPRPPPTPTARAAARAADARFGRAAASPRRGRSHGSGDTSGARATAAAGPFRAGVSSCRMSRRREAASPTRAVELPLASHPSAGSAADDGVGGGGSTS